MSDNGTIRQYTTGATRDTADNKLDYAGFESPLVMNAFARYMHKHRIQPDGTLRDSDNWKKGIPLNDYMSSMFRHFMDVWMLNQGVSVCDEKGREIDMEEALCGLRFNVNGYLHGILEDNVRKGAKIKRGG